MFLIVTSRITITARRIEATGSSAGSIAVIITGRSKVLLLPVQHIAQLVFLLGELLQFLLLLLQNGCGDACGIGLSAQQQIPELFHERGCLLLQKARNGDLQLTRVQLLVHLGLQQINDHGDHNVVLKAQQLRDALCDPLVDHVALHFDQVHAL